MLSAWAGSWAKPKEGRMGLTKRKDSYYIEFHVLDDGKVLLWLLSAQEN